jgi:hypothetical protein
MPRYKKTHLWKVGAAILCAGLFYGYILIPAGIRIACPLRTITGLRCPGCGITDLCLAILHGRIKEAPAYNWGVSLAAPWLAGLGIYHVRGGNRRVETIVSELILLFLVGWTVYRNLHGI